MSYALLVLYDEAVAKPSQNNNARRELFEIDEERIKKAKELFQYGISLIQSFKSWDKDDLPNPELYDSNDAFWIEKANGLFVFAINFILCHEFAHVEKEHLAKRIAGQNTVNDRVHFEKEADQRAIELMLLGATSQTEKSMKIGILIGLLCLLFFRGKTKSLTHPDTDDRIHLFITKINPDPADAEWGISALAYKFWDDQFSKNFLWPNDLYTMMTYIR